MFFIRSGHNMFSKEDLRKLVYPLIIEQFLIVTIGMVDSLMVSSVGEAAVSGVSIVDSINILLIGLFGALATGGAVISAQFLGHKQRENACMAAEQLLLVTLGLSVIIMVITLACNNLILELLYGKVAPDVMKNAQTFFNYSALSYPFIAIYNACAAIFRSMGNSRISMWISFIMNIVNTLGNIIFIMVLHLGVTGSALATLISRGFAAICLYSLLRNKNLPIHIGTIRSYHFQPIMIRKILRIGVPNGLENSVFQVGKILVQGMISGLGTSAITANAVGFAVSGFGVLPGSAMGIALITVVGQCMGACDFDAVKQYTRKLMKQTYLLVAMVNVIIVLLVPLIVKAYHLSDHTALLASQLLIYHCVLATLIWPLSFTLPSALRAANDVKFTMWISMISMWVWRIGLSYFLAITCKYGVLGVWIAMTIDWMFRSVCFVIRFHKGKYRTMAML